MTHQLTHKSDTAISSPAALPFTSGKQVPDSNTIGCDSGNATTERILTGETTRWKSKVGRPNGSTEKKSSTKRERLSKSRTSAQDNLPLLKKE